MALKYNLNLSYDKVSARWMVDSIQFGEVKGDGDDDSDLSDIHTVNEAMKIVSKIIDIIDIPIVATSIDVVPGQPVSK
jgi:hypothetical protein